MVHRLRKGGCLVTPFSHFSVKHLGEERSFKIVGVKSSSDKPHQNGTDENELSKSILELEQELPKLSLNESTELNGIVSTPVADLHIFKVTSRTKFTVSAMSPREDLSGPSTTRLSDIGGLEKQIQLLSDLVLHPLEAAAKGDGKQGGMHDVCDQFEVL